MSDRLVTVATFNSVMDAGFIQQRLEAEGVRTFLADTAAVEVAWHLTVAMGGVKLQVMEADAERALAIIEAYDRELLDDTTEPVSEMAEEDELVGEDEANVADDLYETGYASEVDDIVNRALRAAILGLIFLPLQVYSLCLILRVKLGVECLDPANRRRLRTALMLDMFVVVVIGTLLLSMLHVVYSY